MSDKVSYVGEFFVHRYNQVAMLGATCAAVFASLPFGWNGFALVGVLAAGAEIIGALTIPDLPSFRSSVDSRLQRKAREQRRGALLAELKPFGDTAAMSNYQHMCDRVNALYRTAGDSRSALTSKDVEGLDNLTVDFLGLCLLNLSLKSRKETASADAVQKKMAAIESQLERAGLPQDEERQLRRAMAQYAEVLQRARRLAIRRASLEATLLSMPDKMEEVYQLVMSSPYSSDIGAELEESLSRLRIAEEVAAEFEDPDPFELDKPARPVASPEPAAAARRAAQSLKN
ncbi:MAG: hypothetical protein EOO28_04330 [Comamonadaceae bacterium]|nr:MAG: hypothetical protein EOO28_04330 [Comamonadaceae bacterium]